MGLLGDILQEEYGILLEADAANASGLINQLKEVIRGNGIDENGSKKYPTYFNSFNLSDKSEEDLLYNGYVNIPETLYYIDFEIAQPLAVKKSMLGAIDIYNTDDQHAAPIEDEKWQYYYSGWGQTLNINAFYISNKGRFIPNKGFPYTEENDTQVDAGNYTYAKNLTDAMNNLIATGKVLPKIMRSYGNFGWHIVLAKSFVPAEKLTYLPYNCDGNNNLNFEQARKVVVKDGIIVPTDGQSLQQPQVDHINGVHDNNVLSNLRITTPKDNIVSDRMYQVILWTISLKNSPDIPDTPIEIHLEYDSKQDTTIAIADIDGDEFNIINAPKDLLSVNKSIINNQEMTSLGLRTMNFYGELSQDNPTLQLIQAPVCFELSNESQKIASSFQEAGYYLDMEPEEVASYMGRPRAIPTKPNKKGEAPLEVLNMYYANNQILQIYAQQKPLLQEDVYMGKKTNEVKSLYGKGEESYETISQMKKRIEDIHMGKYGASYKPKKKSEVLTHNEYKVEKSTMKGTFQLCRYNSLRSEYLNINSDKFPNEKWYRAIYLVGKNSVKATSLAGNKIEFYVADELSTKPMEFENKTVYDSFFRTDTDKCYAVMCSDAGRVAFFDRNNGIYNIQTSAYLSHYPHTHRLNTFHKYTTQITEDGLQITNIEQAADPDVEYHRLVYFSIKFEEVRSFYTRYQGKAQPFIHHKNGDTSIFGFTNLELVSNFENTLFSTGFDCIGLFRINGTKMTPVMVWPNIENPEIGTFEEMYNKSRERIFQLIGSTPWTAAMVKQACHKTDNFLPDSAEISMTNGFIYRLCLTKDYRFQIADPENAAKEVVAILYKNKDGKNIYDTINESGWWSLDENRMFLSQTEVEQYGKDNPEWKQMIPFVNSIEQQMAVPQSTSPLQESINKMRSLIGRMK